MMEQVGRYKIKGQLGRGAMGVVYLADDPLLNRQAAIKTVDLASDDAAQREFLHGRLLRDARAAAGLAHPNIVGVFDVVEEGDAAYLVMEYIAGETLAAVLNRTAVPDTAFTLRVLRDMASALDYTHARGIVHRDIKPANVMIDTTGAAKIMDFGIARIADTRTTTPTGMVMGTIEYMSPEQVKGEAVDGRSDQFALAAVAYRMLTGTTLFGQHSLATLAYKIVNEQPPAMRMRNAALGSALDAVVSRALAKTPGERYASCSEFVEALAAAVAAPEREEPTLTMAPPVAPMVAAPVVAAPVAKKSHGAAIAVGVVVVLAAAGAAVWRPWEKPAGVTTQAVVEAPAAAPKDTAIAPPTRPKAATQPASASPAVVEKSAAEPAVNARATEEAGGAADEIGGGAEVPAAEPTPAETPHPAIDAHKEGLTLLNANQVNRAIDAFSKAIAIRPDWPQPYLDRARAYQRKKEYRLAVSDYDHFLQAKPKNAYGHALRGTAYWRMKDDDRAFEDFTTALGLKADQSIALYGRGMVRMDRASYRTALEDFNAAIRAAPNYGAAYSGRAAAKRKLGDTAGAEADARRAQELAGRGGDGGR